jgi:signal peptidase I
MSEIPDRQKIISEVGFSLLTEGTILKIRADGYSMYPLVKPGSVLFIEPVTGDSFPSPGEIVAWKRDPGFVVHRLIRIEKKGREICFVTRGDSCRYEDSPHSGSLIAGRVVRVESTSGSLLLEGDQLIRKPAYLYNRFLVWGILKIRRILNFL